MLRKFNRRPSPAMAVAFVALLAALSGTAVALPGKNTVDSGDLKKNAVKNADIAKNAVNGKKVKNSSLASGDVKNESLTGDDVKNESLTGSDINESTLGKVPSAGTADIASALVAPEAYREIGAPGNPTFGGDCHNAIASGSPDVLEKAAFFKDHEGVVHLRGIIECDPTSANPATNIAWVMPPGYRPRDGRLQIFTNAICSGSCAPGSPVFIISGTGTPPLSGLTLQDGAVAVGDVNTSFDGVSFRAEG
jgi:hypothetical protein